MSEVVTNKNKKDSNKARIEYMRDQHRQKVKGMFKFYEVPGGQIEFDFLEFRGDPVQHYVLQDGEIYEIPLGVARHLNKNGWYPVHKHEVDGVGKSVQKIGQKVRRFGFQSLEFVDEVDMGEVGKGIVTVENIAHM